MFYPTTTKCIACSCTFKHYDMGPRAEMLPFWALLFELRYCIVALFVSLVTFLARVLFFGRTHARTDARTHRLFLGLSGIALLRTTQNFA